MNLSLKKRIWGSFIALVFIFLVNGVITIATLNKSKKLSAHVSTVTDPTQQLMGDMKTIIIESKMYATNWVFLRSNQEDKDALNQLHVLDYPRVKKALQQLTPKLNNGTVSESLNYIFKEFEDLVAIEKGIMTQLAKFEDYDSPEKKLMAEQVVEFEVIPRTSGLLHALEQVSAITDNIEMQHEHKRERYAAYLRLLITILVITVTAIGIFLAYYFTRVITHPIRKMQYIIRGLGKGIIRKVNHKAGNDEIGEMILLVNNLCEKLQETADFAHEVGNRNYAVPYKPLSNEDTLGKALVTMRDNIKTGEETLLKTSANLIQRNQALEQYTFIVSHNLRAPVATILGLTDLLNDNGVVLSEEYAAMLRGLRQSAEKLDAVIHDLNMILQIKQQLHEAAEEISLTSLVNEIQLIFYKLMKEGNIQIRYDFSNKESIVSLKSYLVSIFYNLISNSIKYRRPDVDLIIDISSYAEDDKTILVFRDNGKGIDMKKNGNRMFGLYERFDLGVEGKGMGLFMVKTQIENLEGKISVASEVNEGTEFTIELPALAKHTAAPQKMIVSLDN